MVTFPAKTPGAEMEKVQRAGSLTPELLNAVIFAHRRHWALSGDIFGWLDRVRAQWVKARDTAERPTVPWRAPP